VTTAVLVMAYGTPRSLEDVEDFYTDIRRGRPPTPEQLAELVGRYVAIGGASPLVERTEAQRDGLQRALDERVPDGYEVVLGFRHAAPTIEAAVDEIASRGIDRMVGLVLAPHHSALSVGHYLGRASDVARAYGIDVVGIERWHLLPAYVDFLAVGVRRLRPTLPANSKVVFTAHSLPARVLADGDPYPDELYETAAAVAAAAGLPRWAGWGTAWQSAGRTPEPWLQPDLLSVIDDLGASEGADGLLVCPCGFVADHLEVLYDLDVEAARRAEANGLAFARTPCVNDDRAVLAALADLVVEVDR
jgi:protoporphyrin/coproporphyrin ferrochelatase